MWPLCHFAILPGTSAAARMDVESCIWDTLMPLGSYKMLGRTALQFVCDAIMRGCGAGTVLYPAGTVKRLLSGGADVETFSYWEVVVPPSGSLMTVSSGSRKSEDRHTWTVLVIGAAFPSAELAGMVVDC